ncbi:hypothetical protein LOY37_18290 [Pseudomonas sp. B21-012]|uniref:hypothetical protein n=1 Tax=unclassified Pseudomonas TaxID=196821 RepID=UPI001BCFC417|nr:MULTISPECIES: hypothetical protein [unclassified Pseudomonas]QVM98374.1 hypothetical protein JYG36_09460 [Pseudomonas sp. SORT22]UVM54300.1 hypothetical protein LOY37_18290 [Pseudomonas sp. B21-012]
MSEYILPLKRVMLLQHVLENGGTTTCPMRRPETSIDARIDVENDDRTHRLKVTFGPLTGSLTLQRGDSAKYIALRDFMQDLANGRTESGQLSQQAFALMEALDSVNGVLEGDQIAYITPTTNSERPFGVVVTNVQGEICAAVTGRCKNHLAESVRVKLRPTQEGAGSTHD